MRRGPLRGQGMAAPQRGKPLGPGCRPVAPSRRPPVAVGNRVSPHAPDGARPGHSGGSAGPRPANKAPGPATDRPHGRTPCHSQPPKGHPETARGMQSSLARQEGRPGRPRQGLSCHPVLQPGTGVGVTNTGCKTLHIPGFSRPSGPPVALSPCAFLRPRAAPRTERTQSSEPWTNGGLRLRPGHFFLTGDRPAPRRPA